MSSVGGRQSPNSVGSDAPSLLSPSSNSFGSANGGPGSPGISSPSFNIGSSGNSFINSTTSGTSNGSSPSQFPPNHPLAGSKHLCSICEDRASGKHYGVYSCEGCKGFFKRTVRKELVYSCREQKICTIDKRQRNRCQYCRYRKCLSCGMKREAVQFHLRIKQEERQRTKEKAEMNDCNQSNGTVSDMPVSRIREAEMLSDTSHEMLFFDTKIDMSHYYQAATDQMEQLVQWAKHVPHFSSLSLKDQLTLLKAGWNELLIASFSHRSMNVEDTIILSNGVSMDRTVMRHFDLDQVYDRVFSELVYKMKEMKMDKTELGCLRAIVLYNPDAKDLCSTNDVEVLREKVYATLEEYTKTEPVLMQELGRFPKLLLRLPALRSIGLKCPEHLFYKLNTPPFEKYLLNLLKDDKGTYPPS